MARQLVMDLDALEPEARHKMNVADNIHEHADLYQAITADVEAWPYGAKTAPVDKWVWDHTVYPLEELQLEDEETVAGVVRFKAIQDKVVTDFKKVVEAMTMGAMQPHEGGMFATDYMGFADIGPFMLGCSTRATIEVDWADPEKVVPDVEPWHAWSAVDPTNEYWDATIEVEGKRFGVKYWGRMYYHDFYIVLRNLCAAGYERKVREVITGDTASMRKAETIRANELANANGAIVSIDRRLTAFSTKELQGSFMPSNIKRLPAAINMKSAFDSNGMLSNALQGVDLEELDEVQEAFLGAVSSMVEDTVKKDDITNEVTFSVPKILGELGIDPRPYSKRRELAELDDLRVTRMLEFIDPFDRCVGLMPDGSFYKVLTFGGYDAESKTMTIYVPYVFQLARRAQQADRDYRHRYLHGDVVTERNLAAVELANRIICGLVRRGLRTDQAQGHRGVKDENLVSYTPTYKSLIDSCPTLKRQLEGIEHPCDKNGRETERRKNWSQLYNSKLRNAFESAYRIIEEKSDVPEKYLDFQLPTKTKVVTVGRGDNKRRERRKVYDVPTKSTIGRKMRITHHGRRPVG